MSFAAEVVDLQVEGGRGYTLDELTKAVKTHKPALLFLVQVSLASLTCASYVSDYCIPIQKGVLHATW
jgi:hypothetical protein